MGPRACQPATSQVRKLIDHTAGAVSMYDWEFEKLLTEREFSNSKFDFMKTGEAAIPGGGGPPAQEQTEGTRSD